MADNVGKRLLQKSSGVNSARGPDTSIKAIIFDFDDTLIVSRSDRANRLVEALKQFGCPVSEDKLESNWGRPFYELATAIAPEVATKFDAFLMYYANLLQLSPPVACPGVIEVLPNLYKSAFLFVHSSSNSLLIRTDLQSLGILRYFQFVCGSDWQPRPKPNGESIALVAMILASRGVDRVNCCYVGDSDSDAQTAMASQLKFIRVDPLKDVSATQDSNGQSFRVVQSLLELPLTVCGM